MSAKDKFYSSYDSSKFRPGQREAAALLVEREFTPKSDRKSLEQVAQEAGVVRKTLYHWQYFDSNFIAYKNYLATEFVDSHLPFVYRKLIEGIDNGSMKGIETFLKRIGDMDTKSDVTIHQGGNDESFEDRKQELMERIKQDGSDSNDS